MVHIFPTLLVIGSLFMGGGNSLKVGDDTFILVKNAPFVVYVFNVSKNQHEGAGTILNALSVLTTCSRYLDDARQIAPDIDTLWIVAGVTVAITTFAEMGQRRQVSVMHKHPRCYDQSHRGFISYDISVMKLSEPLEWTNSVKPVDITHINDTDLAERLIHMKEKGAICSVFKWSPLQLNYTTVQKLDREQRKLLNTSFPAGAINSTGSTSVLILTDSTVSVVTSTECRDTFCMVGVDGCRQDFRAFGHFCTNRVFIDSHSCNDTGGPLMCNKQIFGVVNREICEDCSPTVYTTPVAIRQMFNIL